MKNYTFHSGQYQPVAQFLYNTYKHIHLQDKDGWCCYYVLDKAQNCVAFIWIHVEKEKASSPLKAPFGSVEFRGEIDAAVLFDFINFILADLNKKGVKKLLIKQIVDGYQVQKNAIINTLLLNLGFKIVNAEAANLILVNSVSYENKLHAWEKRKLKQAKKQPFDFHVLKTNKLTNIYKFIQTCRAEKKYSLSMSLPALKKLEQTIPDSLQLFSVQQGKELIAACIAIRVSPEILYTFYYDHARAYQKSSPVVMLIEGIYEYCLQNNIELLDLGTAALDGKPNFSLLTFKQHLGASYSTKFTFEKILNG
ncbi:MAG: hypothetical protein EBR30_21595 [Cytophagia bacterium]|nr:hypothetical protein [Cytophagia bacterium]